MSCAENFKIINSVTLLKYAEIFDYMLKHASWSPPHTLQPFCDRLCDFLPFNVNFTAVLCSELSDDCTQAHVNSTILNTCFLHKHNKHIWIQPARGHYAHYIGMWQTWQHGRWVSRSLAFRCRSLVEHFWKVFEVNHDSVTGSTAVTRQFKKWWMNEQKKEGCHQNARINTIIQSKIVYSTLQNERALHRHR